MPKIGLEIHQRFNTGKLFCSCPTIEQTEPELSISRKLNLVKSEVFEIDKAAEFESRKDKKFIYNFNPSDSCLVELDEEPVHAINKEALLTALAVALKLNMKIFPYSQIMRKIVIDGSNTSGFQRTALIAVDGFIGDVGIETLCIEEESAGIISKEEETSSYNLSRLGIPLIEIATAPTIKNGKHAKEIAKEIGMLLRMTGKAMRGIGTIRQDLNVSVEGGARVEIKGAQDLNLIEKWVEFEIKRQENLIEIIKELKSRNAYKKLEFNVFDVSSAVYSGFPEKALKRGESVIAIPLPEHAGLLGKEISPERRYGSELSDYAKQAGVKGIIHSDENLKKYGIDGSKVSSIMHLEEKDGFAIVVAREEIAKKALHFVYERAKMDYVPKEVRKTLKNGSTAFMRPLPGKARMYPETDVPLLFLSGLINSAKLRIPKSYQEQLQELENEIGNKDIAFKLASSELLPLYQELKSKISNPAFLAYLLTEGLSIAAGGNASVFKDAYEVMYTLCNLFEERKVTKKGAVFLLKKHVSSGESIEQLLEKEHLKRITGEELKNLLKQYDYNIKEIMKNYSLRVEGKELKELLSKKGM